MKKALLVSLIVVLSLLAGFAIPVFAHGPQESDESADEGIWEIMHEACEEGDWEAMDEAAEEFHEENGYAPCHDESAADKEDWSGHMSGGMMGYGSGSMMDWR